MKLSKNTLTILKNFSNINSNILLKEGSQVVTMGPAGNIFAETTVTEEFPIDFGIYDLHEFLGIISLFNDPDLEFNSKFVAIKEGSKTIKFYAANPSILSLPPQGKKINLPDNHIEFSLPNEVITNIIKTASVLRSEDVAIVGDGSTIKIVIADKKNATANSFEHEIGQTESTFRVYLKVALFKFIPFDYNVVISKAKKISKFTSSDENESIIYYIGLEQDSTIE